MHPQGIYSRSLAPLSSVLFELISYSHAIYQLFAENPGVRLTLDTLTQVFYPSRLSAEP